MSATPTVAEPTRVPLVGRRVLVIEDEYFLADDIARALTSLGAEIIGPVDLNPLIGHHVIHKMRIDRRAHHRRKFRVDYCLPANNNKDARTAWVGR